MDTKQNNPKATKPISDDPKRNDLNPNQSLWTPPQHPLKLPKIKDSLQFAQKPLNRPLAKVPGPGNICDRTAQEDRRRNLKNSLTVLINNEKKATEPNIEECQQSDKKPVQAACPVRMSTNVLKESFDNANKRASLTRAGFAPEKPTRSPHENSPLTPNFVMGNHSRTKEEKSDFSVTVDQVNTQKPLNPKKSESYRQLQAEEDMREVSPNSQFLNPKLLTTQSRENSAHVTGSLRHLETYTNQRTDVLTNSQHHKISNSQTIQAFHKSSSQNSLLINKANNKFKMLNQDSYDLGQDQNNTDAHQRANTGAMRFKNTSSKYQKLPPRKGKYNEPYHDGLYRFQDAQLVIPKATNSNTSKANPDGGKMPKIEPYGNSGLTERQVAQREDDDYRAVTRNSQNVSTAQAHPRGDDEGVFDHNGEDQHESGQQLDGSNENGVGASQPKNIIAGESCQIKQNQEDTEHLRRQGAKSSCSQDSDQESEAQYYLLGLSGAKTYISPEQFQKMKQLNPSLQFADEEGGVLQNATNDANVVIDGTEQEDFLKQENVMSTPINQQTQQNNAEVAPTQLKPGEFQNNDGSGSQMGRWTREEHLKFVKALQLFGKDWQSVQKFIVTRSSAQIRSHAQKFFNQIKRKGGQVLIRDNKQRQSRTKKKIANNLTQNVEVYQSCIIAQSTMQDESQMSQVGTLFGGDQKTALLKENSATSLDGRDLPEAPVDGQGNVLFAVQRCLSRHEIDKAKEEILYDEHLNPKPTFAHQFNDSQQQETAIGEQDEQRREVTGIQASQYPDIQICDIDQPMEDAHRKAGSGEAGERLAEGAGGHQEQDRPMEAQAHSAIQNKESRERDSRPNPQKTVQIKDIDNQNKLISNQSQKSQPEIQDQKIYQSVLISSGVQTRRERRMLEAAQLQKQVQSQLNVSGLPIQKMVSEEINTKKSGVHLDRSMQISVNSKKILKSHALDQSGFANALLKPHGPARKVAFEDQMSAESRKRLFQARKVLQNRRSAQALDAHNQGNGPSAPPGFYQNNNHNDDRLEVAERKSSSESEIIKFYRNNAKIKDERFANKLILKYNILTLNKKRIVEQIQAVPELGPRFLGYLGKIDAQVEQIQKHLPTPLSNEPDARDFINNSGDSLQVFLQIFDQFLLLERQHLQQRVSPDNIINNLVLLHQTKLNMKQLEDVSKKVQELCNEVQALNDTIKEFASQQNCEENKEGNFVVEEKPPVITQCDILNNGGSGIIQCTCILHLELLLSDEFFTKLIAQMKEFMQQLHTKLVQMNPEIERMNLEEDENVQVLNELTMQHNQQQERQLQQQLQAPGLVQTLQMNDNAGQIDSFALLRGFPQDHVMFPSMHPQSQVANSQANKVPLPSAAVPQRPLQPQAAYGKVYPSVKPLNSWHKK